MRWWALASLVRGDGACAAGKNAPDEPTTWRESNAALPDCSPQGASATRPPRGEDDRRVDGGPAMYGIHVV